MLMQLHPKRFLSAFPPSFQVKKQLNEENTRLRQQIEQERRDHELALRLAHESNSSIEDLNTPQVRTST